MCIEIIANYDFPSCNFVCVQPDTYCVLLTVADSSIHSTVLFLYTSLIN